jgi:hypothetical protein
LLQIQTSDSRVIECGAGKAAEPAQVNVRVIEFVMSGDEAGKHACVRRRDIFGNEGNANAGHGSHPESFEDRDVRMAAANQYQVFDYRSYRPLHGFIIQTQSADSIRISCW